MLVCSTLAGHDGTTVLLLGLSRANLERLEAGDPIRVTRATHGLPVPETLTVLIIAGETEASMEADLRHLGAITDETVMNGRPM